MLQFIDVMNSVHLLLHLSPNFVVEWVQICAVGGHKGLMKWTTCILSQLLSKVTRMLQFFIKCLICSPCCGRPTQAGEATNQRCDRWNAAIVCPTQWQLPASAGWLSWIVDVDKPSVEGHPKQCNRLDSSPGCLGATCEARWTWRSHTAGTSVCDGAPSCRRHPCKMPALLLQYVTVTLDNNWDNIHVVPC